MRIVISGASGLIGSTLVRLLEQWGHDVRRLVRPPGATGPRHIRWDPARNEIDRAALAGTEAVIHLSGENILGRWTDAKRRRIRESRVASTRLLAAALAGLQPRPRVLIGASAVGYYGDRGDETLTEDSASGHG